MQKWDDEAIIANDTARNRSAFKNQMLISCFVLLAFLFAGSYSEDTRAAEMHNTLDYIDNVDIGEGRTRFYLAVDHDGTVRSNHWENLDRELRAGDEIAIRFYPSRVLGLNLIDASSLSDIVDSLGCKLLFPSGEEVDTLTIEPGQGSLTFIGREDALYAVRLVPKATDSIGSEIDLLANAGAIHARSSRREPVLTDELRAKGDFDQWSVLRVDFQYPKGTWFVEVLQIGGSWARIVARTANPIDVRTTIQQASVSLSADGGAEEIFAMQRGETSPFFEGIVSIKQTGMYRINVQTLLTPQSWVSRQVPSALQPLTLLQDDLSVVVRRTIQHPSALRARVGYAAFNRARESRLIANFALILSPKNYFSENLSVLSLNRISPTTGLQIGGTGEQDVVFLLGLSYKLIDQADMVFGCRFGKDTATAWKFSNNAYFGVTLDPGLFDRLSKER